MQSVSVAVIGASGYSGVELTHLLAIHPRAELALLTSDRWHGSNVRQRTGIGGAIGQMQYAPQDQSIELSKGCHVAFLATPAEVSLDLAPKLMAAGVERVIDLSGAFRLRDVAQYNAYYGFNHGRPDLLSRAVYGLPELFRSEIPGAKLIANPGCYATVAALALAPLLKARLIDESYLIIDAASGTTGAGRKATEDMSFTEVNEDFRAYKVHRHQHTPEITQTLARAGNTTPSLTFTPHLLPTKRGILVTAYARLKAGVDPKAPLNALVDAYADTAFVDVISSPDAVTLKSVVGTNRCVIAAAPPPSPELPLVVVAAIDNLVKGAAGQAIQNWNLASGWAEDTGLSQLRSFAP
jgi:N-acetyl-gamma-glutamyl-phosphate reductase